MSRSPHEGLQVSLQAYKSMISDYALRARQAEEMVSVLMQTNLGPELMASTVVNKIKEHIESRELERSTQLLGVIQTTLLALTTIQRSLSSTEPQKLDSELLTIIKALTVSVNPN